MKKIHGPLAFVALLTPSLWAFGATLPVNPGPVRTVGEMSAALKNQRPAVAMNGNRRLNAIAADFPSYALLIPGAGNLPGSNGTYFRSDVVFANYLNVDQIVAVAWLAEGQDNSAATFQYLTIPAQRVVSFDDFVGQTLQKQGLGAVEILAVDSSHRLDANAYFDAYSRIWTYQPGGQGTTSLQLPAVSLAFGDLVDNPPAFALGMKQTAQYHANVGIVNLDLIAHTWTVSVNGQSASTTFPVTVPANSLQQVGIPAGDFGDLWLGFQLSDGTLTDFSWSAYGVTEDNVTGDGWAAHAIQP
ncbi:MAG: hypothetical protein ACRD16_16780 [Thermoanaerobaculia bacterium]